MIRPLTYRNRGYARGTKYGLKRAGERSSAILAAVCEAEVLTRRPQREYNRPSDVCG